MIDRKTIKKISLAILIPLSIILITFTISTVLILNTNYVETGILKEQTDKYQYLATDFSNQIIASESVLAKLENNTTMHSIFNLEHLNSNEVSTLFDSIDFEQLLTDMNEESIFDSLMIYTSNPTITGHSKFTFLTNDIKAEEWYNTIVQSRRKWLLTFNDDQANILYKMTIPDNFDNYEHIGYINLDLSSLLSPVIDDYKIMFTNVASNKIIDISGDRILNFPLTNYIGISESMYLDDEMVLSYVIVQGTSVTRWNLMIVLEKSNFIYEFMTYAIAILSVFAAIAFMFGYRLKYIKKVGKSFENLSYDNIESIIASNNPSDTDQIVQSLYLKVESLVKKNQELDLMNQQKENQKNEAEIKALLSQISPHYIFNLLNSIHKQAIKNNETKTAKMILLMSKQLRRSLEWKEPFVTIKDELEHIKSYILLQQHYHGIEYQFSYDIDESLCNIKIPKLILQTLIENALKHGIETKPFEIRLEKDDNNVRFTMTNEVNGDIIEISNRINSILNNQMLSIDNEGIGLQNMIKRLKYYYGDLYEMKVSSFQQKIEITVKFPIQREEEKS